MMPSFADPALYFKMDESGMIIGISDIYIDNSLHCGNEQFLHLTYKSLPFFDSRKQLMGTKFSCVYITCQKKSMP